MQLLFVRRARGPRPERRRPHPGAQAGQPRGVLHDGQLMHGLPAGATATTAEQPARALEPCKRHAIDAHQDAQDLVGAQQAPERPAAARCGGRGLLCARLPVLAPRPRWHFNTATCRSQQPSRLPDWLLIRLCCAPACASAPVPRRQVPRCPCAVLPPRCQVAGAPRRPPTEQQQRRSSDGRR
jgi:hypothetical protein